MPHTHTRPPLTGWLILNLMFQISFGLMAMTLCLPSMQEWGQIFDADQAAVQLTFSAYVMAYGGMQLVYGPLSDRHGRKRVLMIGLAVAGLGSLMGALSTGLSGLIAARVLQGMGGAASIVVGRSMVQDLFDGPQRTRVMAYIGMVMGLCPPLGTIVGGQLHVRLGWAPSRKLPNRNRNACNSLKRSRPGLGPRPKAMTGVPRRARPTGCATSSVPMCAWHASRSSCCMSWSWPAPRPVSMCSWRARPSCWAATASSLTGLAGTSCACRCSTWSAIS